MSDDKKKQIMETMDNSLSISVSLHDTITAMAKVSISKKDDKLLEEALDRIKNIPMITYRSSALRNISRLLVSKNPAKAQELLNTAIELIQENHDIQPIFRVFAWCDIASLLAQFNDPRSSEFIKRSIAIADNIEEDFERSAVLLKIVQVGTAIGKKRNDDLLLNEAHVISKGITKEYYKTLAYQVLHDETDSP